MLRKYFSIFIMLGIAQFSWAQTGPVPESDTTKTKEVEVLYSDVALLIQEGDTSIQKLMMENRQIELKQGDAYMYCDSAIIIDNDVVAYGNVLIQQGDTLAVFADSLRYNGNNRKARLFGNVSLENKGQKLFTQQLFYDMEEKVATYYTGATLTNDTTFLQSKIGYYYMKTDEAFFKDSVTVKDSAFVLFSDTLKFETKTRKAIFLGPTLIEDDSAKIYCEAGFYNLKDKTALFTENAQYEKGEQRAVADTITYNGELKQVTMVGDAVFRDGLKVAEADSIQYTEPTEVIDLIGDAYYRDEKQEIRSNTIKYGSKTESFATTGRARMSDPPQIIEADQIDFDGTEGLAVGNVIWRDTAEKITVISEVADYNKETEYLKASGDRPLLISIMDDDTLYMRADTLVSQRKSEIDSSKLLIAYDRVRIFKSDLQGICDSLAYATADSLFEFYQDPILWSDTSQFSADTLKMLMVENKVNRINMYNNSFINNSTDEVLFNQIRGRNITAYFKEEELDWMNVIGNAESVYYAKDEEEAYIGVNKTAGSRMKVLFGSNEIERIIFYTEPTGQFLPMGQANHEELKLQGFKWVKDKRPLSFDDL